jgi:hypothetical protein
MMKFKKEPDLSNLIQQARQAQSRGEDERARELALLATADPTQEEQAWLVLASLSEPQQAMLYIENALKVNPESRAARKAIRLVYSQMAARDEDEGEEPFRAAIVPPIKPLEDTSPIPIMDISSAEVVPEEELEEIRNAQAVKDIPVPATTEAQEPLSAAMSASISKEALRVKLRQRSGAAEIVEAKESGSLVEEAVLTEPSPKKKIKFLKKAKVLEEIEAPPILEAAENTADEKLSAPAAEPETEIAPEAEESQAVAPAIPMAETKGEAVEEVQTDEPVEAKPAPSLPEPNPAPKAVERALNEKSNRKIAVAKPEQTPQAVSTPINGKTEGHNNKQDPSNVDTIELILVSIAAILLPLLVFLYFYLTK